jgi:glutamate synthase domain-containing protein 2
MDGTLDVLGFLAYAFIVTIGVGVLAVVVLFVLDVTQTEHAVRRNFPVIGRFRYWFEHLGEFFRQYFFALDREGLPFNRAERAWSYRASKGVDNTIAFGSTRDLRRVGTVIFVNDPWPVLEHDIAQPQALTIGPYCRAPYATAALVNISGMSFGAISKPAVRALSSGAKRAGIWLNTGEGGLSSYHLEGGADIVFQIGTAKYGVRDAEGKLSDERLAAVAAHEQAALLSVPWLRPGTGPPRECGAAPFRKTSRSGSCRRCRRCGACRH